MEARKVQIIGGSTFIVSLPKSWATDKKLKHGDTMYILPQLDGSLMLRPEKLKDEEPRRIKKISIDSVESEHLMRELIGSYISGYELIELSTTKRISPELRETIREFTRAVIGPEIIDESLKKITVQDFIDLTDLSLKKGVRRMYLMAKSMHTDAFTALSERNTDLALDISSRDAEVDRFFWLISKQFNLILSGKDFSVKGGMDLRNSLNFFLVARIIERIGDHAAKISENIINLKKKKIPARTLQGIKEINEHYLKMLDRAIEAMFNARADEANSAIDETQTLNTLCEASQKEILKLDSDIAISLAYIIESMRRTGMYATDISEIAINYIVAQVKTKKG
ncbi:MAG: phosphate uptake regulator PhoU [Thermoplasmata archaeon]|nr:MAG: phosphate uptake regulator PhoU [Thermoplasmata archaeon]